MTDEEKGVEIDKGAHQEDGFGGSGLKGGCGEQICGTLCLWSCCSFSKGNREGKQALCWINDMPSIFPVFVPLTQALLA